MFEQIIGVILVWVSNLISNLTYIGSNDSLTVSDRSISYKLVGAILILTSTLGLGWQGYQVYNKDAENRRLKQVLVDTNSHLFNEASGGAAVQDAGYLVDDEKPRIFKLRLIDGVYHYADEIKLRQGDKVFSTDDVDDLESAAVLPGDQFNNKIYLLTSFSNTKKGAQKDERQQILEVSLEPGNEGVVLRRNAKLRVSFLDEFKKAGIESFKNNDGIMEVMQIEGLAIDPNGYAYLGFRAPLADGKNAVVLRAKLEDLFAASPSFKLYRLNLSDDGKNYSISSLDYDPQTQKMLILANGPERFPFFTPLLWQWDYAGPANVDAIQNPKKISPILFKVKATFGRPEVLLIPPVSISDQLYMFLDTDDEGDGGQVTINRGDVRLK